MKNSYHRKRDPVERVWAVMCDPCFYITRIFREESDAIDYIAEITGNSSEYVAEKLKADKSAWFMYYDPIFRGYYSVTLESYEVE